MNSPTIDLLHKHASIRAYKPDPVPRALVETIVAAGQRASTSSNMQYTTAVAVTDERKRLRLAELCGDQEQIRQAPVFIAWCVDRARLDHACQMRGYEQRTDTVESFLVAAMDVAIFMQNAAVAAESLGLGMCYIGAIRNNPRQVMELLGLPRLTFPVSGMTLGWPAAEATIRPRLSLETVLHWENYGDPNEAAHLHAYDKAMAATGIYDNRQVPVPGKPEQMEVYGWTEHSARRVSQRLRADLREILAEQGFSLAD
jgi:FMN reductase (NADPH)